MPTATCDFRFSLQNRYARSALVNQLEGLGITNGAVTFSGRATMGEKTISIGDFVAANAKQIRTRFRRFIKDNDVPRADDLVILDMEPETFAPRQLGDYEGKLQRQLIAAYRLRIEVARTVLESEGFAGRLGLYQVIAPDGRGRLSTGFLRRMCGYLAAGEQGMYDALDVICPVLYQRFGANDAPDGTLDEWVADATRQGIDGSLALTRRNGDAIPLVPILSFWVFNGGSDSNRFAVRPARVARQLEIVQGGDGIEAIVFWSAWQTKQEMREAPDPVEEIAITGFLTATGSLPWPGCP